MDSFTEVFHKLFGKNAFAPVSHDEDIRLAAAEFFDSRVVVPHGDAVDTYIDDGLRDWYVAGYHAYSDADKEPTRLLKLLTKSLAEIIETLRVEKKRVGNTIFISCRLEDKRFDVHRIRPVVANEVDGKNECMGMLDNNACRLGSLNLQRRFHGSVVLFLTTVKRVLSSCFTISCLARPQLIGPLMTKTFVQLLKSILLNATKLVLLFPLKMGWTHI